MNGSVLFTPSSPFPRLRLYNISYIIDTPSARVQIEFWLFAIKEKPTTWQPWSIFTPEQIGVETTDLATLSLTLRSTKGHNSYR